MPGSKRNLQEEDCSDDQVQKKGRSSSLSDNQPKPGRPRKIDRKMSNPENEPNDNKEMPVTSYENLDEDDALNKLLEKDITPPEPTKPRKTSRKSSTGSTNCTEILCEKEASVIEQMLDLQSENEIRHNQIQTGIFKARTETKVVAKSIRKFQSDLKRIEEASNENTGKIQNLTKISDDHTKNIEELISEAKLNSEKIHDRIDETKETLQSEAHSDHIEAMRQIGDLRSLFQRQSHRTTEDEKLKKDVEDLKKELRYVVRANLI